MSNSESRYRPPARVLHWTMAILVLATIPAGFVMVQQGLDRSLQNAFFLFHKNVGVLLLALVVLRGLYRWRHPPAPLPQDLPEWQHRIAKLSHKSLYVLLFVMPIAGYTRVKAGGFPIETLELARRSVPRSPLGRSRRDRQDDPLLRRGRHCGANRPPYRRGRISWPRSPRRRLFAHVATFRRARGLMPLAPAAGWQS